MSAGACLSSIQEEVAPVLSTQCVYVLCVKRLFQPLYVHRAPTAVCIRITYITATLYVGATATVSQIAVVRAIGKFFVRTRQRAT